MSAAASVAIWQGIESEHPPCLRNDYPDLLAMAEKLRNSRREKFPAMVAGGKIAPEEAARQLGLFEQLADHWRWIVTGEGEPAPLETLFDRADALDESLRTIAGIARKHGDFDDELAHQAHCLIALRWHHEPEADARTRFNARLTHTMRQASREIDHV